MTTHTLTNTDTAAASSMFYTAVMIVNCPQNLLLQIEKRAHDVIHVYVLIYYYV